MVEHYEILERHNMDAISDKSNKLIKYAQKQNKYSHILFLESDIGLKDYTIDKLYENMKVSHVSLACGIVPWAGTSCLYTKYYTSSS